MKLLSWIFIVLMSACTVQGNVKYSQGLISGWEHIGFKNRHEWLGKYGRFEASCIVIIMKNNVLFYLYSFQILNASRASMNSMFWPATGSTTVGRKIAFGGRV